uniref:Neuropeptide-Like Protein n=1 Tax=Caenorhabditis japonica TaxID=281687 RepID=A0A8R1IBL8_CAEJA
MLKLWSILSLALVVLMAVQLTTASVVGESVPASAGQVDYDALAAKIDLLRPQRYWKRAHNIDTRALSQFKNCYFSPIQCVLMERRRK